MQCLASSVTVAEHRTRRAHCVQRGEPNRRRMVLEDREGVFGVLAGPKWIDAQEVLTDLGFEYRPLMFTDLVEQRFEFG